MPQIDIKRALACKKNALFCCVDGMDGGRMYVYIYDDLMYGYGGLCNADTDRVKTEFGL